MKINVKKFQELKLIKNSGYKSIKVDILFHSNKIEGSTFTKENLEVYLNDQIIEGSHEVDDIYETINSAELFDFIIDTLDEPISKRLLLEFHQMLKKNTVDHKRGFAGTWKKIPNTILGVGDRLVVAQPYEVPDRIEKLLSDWNKSDKGLEAITKFHVEFEKIHPFQDGNGRVGRFIILKQCIENGVDLISIDEKYSKEYKKSLFTAQTEDDYSALLDILKSCQELLDSKLDFLNRTLNYLSK